MILHSYDKENRYAVVLVDIYDAEVLIKANVDPVTTELMKNIRKKLAEGIRTRVQIPGHKRKKKKGQRKTREVKKHTRKKREKKGKKKPGILDKLRDVDKKLEEMLS